MHKSCVFASIEPRVNKPPVAVVSPKYQEISLPTSSTVIDGSRAYQIFFCSKIWIFKMCSLQWSRMSNETFVIINVFLREY